VLNGPPGFSLELPEGARLTASGIADAVLLFAQDAAQLDEHLPAAVAAVQPSGLLWICYPKGGARAGTDLNRDLLWQRLQDRGLTGVSLVAVDGTWSAMRARGAAEVEGSWSRG
jgi:hypothetical protein